MRLILSAVDMATPRAALGIIALVIITTSGCAAYRVSSKGMDSASMPVAASSGPVQILLAENNLPGRRYIVIGPVQVQVKKLTVFHKDPTREQANEVLIEKARAMGATAVINIKYTSGIGMTSWGVIDAYGTAVKLIN